jgi:hypothetical protein
MVWRLHRGERRDAGPHGLAVHTHGAGAAGCNAAAELGAGELEHVTQHPQQGHRRIRGLVGHGVGAAIDLELHGWTLSIQ